MTKPVRKELDRIERFLLKGNQGAKDLWNILSALRGPDDGNLGAKSTTTIPIRQMAFPKLAQKGSNDNIPAAFGWPDAKFVDPDDDPHTPQHFRQHARDAWGAVTRRGR